MIDKMSEQEKSVMLARLVGWKIVTLSTEDGYKYRMAETKSGERLNCIETIFNDAGSQSYQVVNLYDTANMALAWRVLNWVEDEQNGLNIDAEKFDDCFLVDDFFVNTIHADMSPAEAQAAWLDKILELAIEAGMVKRA